MLCSLWGTCCLHLHDSGFSKNFIYVPNYPDVTFHKTLIFLVTHASTPVLTSIYVLQGSKLIYVKCRGLFISPSGISELDCATTKTDTAESISTGRESLQVFFVLGALAYFQVPPLEGSRDEKWRSQ